LCKHDSADRACKESGNTRAHARCSFAQEQKEELEWRREQHKRTGTRSNQSTLNERNKPTNPEISTFDTQTHMSAFGDLASPAPRVGAATAERAPESGGVRVEPALPCEEANVEPARHVEPAVTVDDPKQFAPKQALKKAEISHLSVTALRASGSDFEGMVRALDKKRDRDRP
jgi:hypothetical protein